MPIASSTRDIELAADKAVSDLLSTMPFNAQDGADREAAEHYALQLLYQRIHGRLDKLDKQWKTAALDGTAAIDTQTEHYARHLKLGTPRTNFNKEQFIELIATTFPELPKHKLRELALDERSFKASAAPVSIDYTLRSDL